MAARIRKTSLTETWRAKIKASMLINRLQDHADGSIEMTPTQVQACKILLDKTISNAPTEIAGQVDGTLEILHRIT
jgi:hypothetical protein